MVIKIPEPVFVLKPLNLVVTDLDEEDWEEGKVLATQPLLAPLV